MLTVVIYIATVDVRIPVTYIFPNTYLVPSKAFMLYKRMIAIRYLIHISKLQLLFTSRILQLYAYVHLTSYCQNIAHGLMPTTFYHTRSHIYELFKMLHFLHTATRSQDSSVGIASSYGLHGPGIESRRGRDFPQPSRPSLSCTMGIGSFPGVKRPGRRVDHPPPSSAPRLKKE